MVMENLILVNFVHEWTILTGTRFFLVQHRACELRHLHVQAFEQTAIQKSDVSPNFSTTDRAPTTPERAEQANFLFHPKLPSTPAGNVRQWVPTRDPLVQLPKIPKRQATGG